MTERKELLEAIAALEGKRGILGEAVVEKALIPLRERLAALDGDSSSGARTAIHPSASHAGERRTVTILFCDVKGSTAMAEQLDPEVWAGIINPALEYLTEPVRRHGGTVAEVRGDGILAFFGAPVAHEDDPQRSVIAGLEILEGIRIFHEQIKQARGLDFNVRVGIHTGLVVAGEAGAGQGGEYTAIGDAVNLAARMEQTARPGTVQISEQTYRLVEQTFECEALGEIKIKGKRAPVRSYRVMGPKALPGSLRGLERLGHHSPLVGREAEVAALKETMDRLAHGQGGIVCLFGEAGLGKSRLVAEVHASTAKLLWLEGQTLSFGQTISYWPFQQILRNWSGIAEDDSEAEAWTKLEKKVRALFGDETIDYLPYLASILALEVKGDYSERVKYLDGEAMGRQIFLTARRFFERLAQEQPVVIVFEDLHWMDESSTHLLEHLLPLVERLPFLILGLSRPERQTPAARLRERCARDYAGYYTEIFLAPLSGADSTQLVHNLLEIEDIPAHLKELVVAKAEGNPFFLEEVIRTLIDTGVVRRDPTSGRVQATVRLETIHIPDTIQGLIMARIDRLDEEVKQVLRVAAVIGRSFLYRVLKAIAEAGRRLDNDLAELQQTELIREKRVTPELEYIFSHALAHEATYESILLQKRRELHARVGAAIENLMADRLDEFYGLLAYHYAAAEQWEQAQEYLFKAGDQALRMAADAEALANYRQAMEAYTRVRGDDWEPIERARLERKIGEAFYRLGEFSQARTYLAHSLALLGESLPASRWGTRLALAGALLTQFGHRLLPRRIARPVSSSPDPAVEEIFLAYLIMGSVEFVVDLERMSLITIKDLNACERGGYAYGSAQSASAMGMAFEIIGRVDLAERYYRLALSYSRQVVPHRPILHLEYNLSVHYNLHGNPEKSREHAFRAAEIARSTGDLRAWGMAMHVVTWAQYFHGMLGKAVETSQEMIALAEEGSDRQVLCWGLFGLGANQRRLGQIHEAIANLQRAIAVAEELPDYYTHVCAGSALSHCHLANGELEQSISVIKTIETANRAHGIPLGTPYLGNARSEAYLAAAEGSTGKARQEWLKKARHSCRETLKAAKINRPTLPEALLFQGRYEWLRVKPESAQKWWRKALEEARRIGDPYLEGVIHLEAGCRLGDHDHLRHAESILEEIGAEFDLAAARNALKNLKEN